VTKTVLITGASGGIGSATVRRLDELGWRVFAGSRSPDAGAQVTDAVPGAIPIPLDVCDERSVAQARDAITGHVDGAGLDGLVNNAGASVDGPIELLPLVALRQQLELNVIGQIAVTQAFLPLIRQAQGRIVNIGGAAGRLALPMYLFLFPFGGHALVRLVRWRPWPPLAAPAGPGPGCRGSGPPG